jgi:predicted O-methyltransferase YrrM
MDIYNKIINREPFCFVRINDGEMSSIINPVATLSRGFEISNELMSQKLRSIIEETIDLPNLFIGIPCPSCYGDYHHKCKDIVIKNKPNVTMVDANILINSNYNKTLDVLMNNLSNRHIVIISNKHAIDNISKLNKLNIFPSETHIVSNFNAFQKDYNSIKNIIFPNNSFIITLCGPLGRILNYEWYKQNNTLSCLDLGSYFDPLLHNKSYFYHTNTFKYCLYCNPTTEKGFTNIFKYCEEPISKECYYYENLNLHISIFNNNYNSILNNTMVRLEREKNEILLYELKTHCYIQDLLSNITNNPKDNTILSCHKQLFELIKLCKENNFKNILEIGFLTGISALVFLENSDANVTSIDLREKDYTLQGKEFIDNKYKNRHKLLIGNSVNIVPNLNELYDLIFIDGNNSYDYILQDIINCNTISHEKTIVVINYIVIDISKQGYWNYHATRAYQKCVSKNLLLPFYEKSYVFGYGLVMCLYNKNIKDNNLLYDFFSSKTEYVNSLVTTMCNNDNNLNKIITHSNELKLLKEVDSNIGYIFQIPEMFEDIINICDLYKPLYLLEIGFLYGSSALLFLLNTKGHLTSIDSVINKFVDYISTMFLDRFTFINDMSINAIPTVKTKQDLILIDGDHSYDTIFNELILLDNIMELNRTIFIINNVVLDKELSSPWNEGPTNIYYYLQNNEMIDVILSKTYYYGRGISIFTFKKKFMKQMNKQEMRDEIDKCISSDNSKLITLITIYLSYFENIIDDDEYFYMKLHLYKNDIDLLEKFISDRHTPLTIKQQGTDFLSKKYNKKIGIIPKIIHLIHLNQRELQKYNYACIRSICKHMPDYVIYIHNDIEPDTFEWNELKQQKNIIIKKINRIKMFDNYPVQYVQYEADILRLQILYEYGGIYMDMDIFILKNIDPLFNGSCIYYGREKEGSLINCILCSEPKNELLLIFLNTLSNGLRMNVWAYHIRDIPRILFEKYPFYKYKYGLHIFDNENFCPISWTEGYLLNNSNHVYSENVYGIHLYETILKNKLNDCYLINNY